MKRAGTMDDLIRAHIAKHIGPVHLTFTQIVPGDPAIDVLYVKATPDFPYEVLVTSGMSSRPMTVPEDVSEADFAEAVAILPKGWPLERPELDDERNYWPIRLLKNVARYPHEHGTYLAWDHTIPNGKSEASAKPYAENTALCVTVLLYPLMFGDEGGWLTRPDGHVIALLAIVPLHLKELAYKNEHSMEALLDLFEKHDLEYAIDPLRPSVVD